LLRIISSTRIVKRIKAPDKGTIKFTATLRSEEFHGKYAMVYVERFSSNSVGAANRHWSPEALAKFCAERKEAWSLAAVAPILCGGKELLQIDEPAETLLKELARAAQDQQPVAGRGLVTLVFVFPCRSMGHRDGAALHNSMRATLRGGLVKALASRTNTAFALLTDEPKVTFVTPDDVRAFTQKRIKSPNTTHNMSAERLGRPLLLLRVTLPIAPLVRLPSGSLS
jgi:hypothetical protein